MRHLPPSAPAAAPVRVAILDDYFDTLHTLPCFARLAPFDVTIFNDHVQDIDGLAERLADVDALVLIRERTRIESALLERLPRLRLISQRSVYPHIDVAACTARGVIVSSNLHADTPSYAAAELTWALVMAAMRQLPQQMAALKRGDWQIGIGHTLRGKTLGIYGWGRIGRVGAGYGNGVGLEGLARARPESIARARAEGWPVASDKQTFFAACDVLSLHMRLLPATRGIFPPAGLRRLKAAALPGYHSR